MAAAQSGNGVMRVVGIIQARMGSTRLPGKSMADLAGRPLLARLLERVTRATGLDEVVVATPDTPEDQALTEVASRAGVSVFRGAEHDLVDRYYQAAKAFDAGLVVRICADNPVIEPAEIDRIVTHHWRVSSDFSSNVQNIDDNGYPDGIGAEVFSLSTLEYLWRHVTDPSNREHPHSFVYQHPERFRIGTVLCPAEFRRPDLKLDVNTPDELSYVRAIYEYCYPRNPRFHITDIVKWHDEVYSAAIPSASPRQILANTIES